MIVIGDVQYAGDIASGLSDDHKTLLCITGDVTVASNVSIADNATMEVVGTVELGTSAETQEQCTITLSAISATFVNNGDLKANDNVVSGIGSCGVFRSAEGVYYLAQPTVTYAAELGGTVVASNSTDNGSTWTFIASGGTFGDGAKLGFYATPIYDNAVRNEFAKYTISTNGFLWSEISNPTYTFYANVDNATNYDVVASFQWKSNYTGVVEVKGPSVWEVREGEDYSKATVSVSEGGTFSSKFENALNVIQVNGTLVWDFTDGAAPSFSPVKTVTCGGTFKIAFDATLTNGFYQILGYSVLSGATSDTFTLTDGATTKTCTANGEWVYFGSRRFQIVDQDNVVTFVVETNPRTRFVEPTYSVQEGLSVKVYVQGGSSDRAVQATVTCQRNTGFYSAAYVDGKKVSFPLTLSWVKGEISAKEILFQTTVSSDSEDRFFTLQLGSPVGEKVLEIGEEIVDGGDVCRVTITDAGMGVDANYVRALAWPAHGGTVSGGGTLAKTTSYQTLIATTKNGSLFAGWFKAQKDNPEVIDLKTPVAPYSERYPQRIRVGYGTLNEAGTYFAYFTNVLQVAGVVEPTPFNEEGQKAEGVAGVTGWDDVNCVYSTMVGVKFALPVGFTDDSGKGKLSVTKLPNGLSFSAKKGLVSGVPTKAGTYNAKFVASNAAGKHTVNYTFVVEEIPTAAVGTFAGVVSDVTNRTGVGSVQFTAGKTGSLSAKVMRRLSGTRSFSVKGYDYIDENTLGIAMTNFYGEVFEATLAMTNGWYDTTVIGTAFGGTKKGTLGYYGEVGGVFSATRNAFSTSDKNEEKYTAAQQILAAFRGNYSEDLYSTNATGAIEGKVGSVKYRVNTKGSVYVAANLDTTYDSARRVSSKFIYGTVAAGLTYDEETDLGSCATALRYGNNIWSTEALFDYTTRDVSGWARYIRPNAEDKSKVVDVDELVGAQVP